VEKAYKLLAIQENISNAQAKKLIDDGLVYVGDKKVTIARGLTNPKSRFNVVQNVQPKVIFEDENIIAVNKPAFLVSETLEKRFNAQLLHRLDKETSGLILLVKNEEFRQKAIEAFRKQTVYKEYTAIVSGIVYEEMQIDAPIKTSKGHKAKSVISLQGQQALTVVTPVEVSGKKSLISAVITTGRTHQIRVHLSHVNHPIIGDTQYGGKSFKRIMLHSKTIRLFDYDLSVNEPADFAHYMQHS